MQFFILMLLVLQPMVEAQSVPLYTNFVLVNLTLSDMYKGLASYADLSVKLVKFDAFDPSIDYSSDTWWNPCYEQYYARKAKYVIFWINGTTMYCEAQSVQIMPTAARFPMANLMRVERLGKRC